MSTDPAIQASLLEAQEYEQRQVLRRRGLVCLQYGLFGLGLALFGLEFALGRESALGVRFRNDLVAAHGSNSVGGRPAVAVW